MTQKHANPIDVWNSGLVAGQGPRYLQIANFIGTRSPTGACSPAIACRRNGRWLPGSAST